MCQERQGTHWGPVLWNPTLGDEVPPPVVSLPLRDSDGHPSLRTTTVGHGGLCVTLLPFQQLLSCFPGGSPLWLSVSLTRELVRKAVAGRGQAELPPASVNMGLEPRATSVCRALCSVLGGMSGLCGVRIEKSEKEMKFLPHC